MKFTESQIKILKVGLQTGFFFSSEYFRIFASSSHLRFKIEDRYYNHEKVLTINEELRFLRSVITEHNGELYCFDYSPNAIILLTKEMKIAIIKTIATNGAISDADLEKLSNIMMCKTEIASIREMAVENYRLIDLFTFIDRGVLKYAVEIIT